VVGVSHVKCLLSKVTLFARSLAYQILVCSLGVLEKKALLSHATKIVVFTIIVRHIFLVFRQIWGVLWSKIMMIEIDDISSNTNIQCKTSTLFLSLHYTYRIPLLLFFYHAKYSTFFYDLCPTSYGLFNAIVAFLHMFIFLWWLPGWTFQMNVALGPEVLHLFWKCSLV
jgi:hypothetical protein